MISKDRVWWQDIGEGKGGRTVEKEKIPGFQCDREGRCLGDNRVRGEDSSHGISEGLR